MENIRTLSYPLVTVGIPTFNRVESLEIALKSILAQSYRNIEIIISDNCSEDTTQSYCMQMAKQDSRIIYIRQDSNIGAIKNFECVLKKAQGIFFMWLADDDSCVPSYVEDLVAVFMQFPDVVLAVSDIRVIDNKNNLIKVENLRGIYLNNDWKRSRKLFFQYPISNIFFSIYGLYKTDVLQRSGSPKPIGRKKFLTNSEVPFLAKLSTQGRIVAIPRALKNYKIHPNSAYIIESKNLNFLDYCYLRALIRIKLLVIILESNLSVIEKISLSGSVALSACKHLLLKVKNRVFMKAMK